MERLNQNNAVVRSTIASVVKAWVAKKQPVYFTNGDVLTVGDDGKMKLETYSIDKGRRITKKWGLINSETRIAMIKQLDSNIEFKMFAENFLNVIPVAISEFYTDTPANRIALAKVIKASMEIEDQRLGGIFVGADGKLAVRKYGVTKKWGRISYTDRVAIVKDVISKNLEFQIKSNEVIKGMKDVYKLGVLVDVDTRDNRAKTASILKAYIASGKTIDFLALNHEGKLQYKGDMTEVTGKGVKMWGTLRWTERVKFVKALKENQEFVTFSNNLL